MTRPTKGLSFDDALQRWSPRDRFAEMDKLKVQVSFRIKTDTPEGREYRRVREELEDALFERLRRAEVLSSADNPLEDPDRPRVLINPSVYEDPSLAYDPRGDSIEGSDFRLQNVQLFSPNRVPVGLERAPLWSPRPNAAPSLGRTESEAPMRGLAAFRHDATHEHVWIGEQEFTLTKFQASVVDHLHVLRSLETPGCTLRICVMPSGSGRRSWPICFAG